MWTFEISTGKMFRPDNSLLATGYSGAPGYIDNPDDEDLKNEGAIPEGNYTILPAYTDPEKGAYVMPLEPAPNNNMYGRDGFLIHGDSIMHTGTASHGCIILNRAARTEIAVSQDKSLQVVANLPTT